MAETNEALAALVASLREGELDFGKPVAETRAYFDAMLAGMPVAEDLTFTPDALAGLPALHTLSPGAATDAALLYLHGGAYISGNPQGYRGLAAELARATGVALVIATHNMELAGFMDRVFALRDGHLEQRPPA